MKILFLLLGLCVSFNIMGQKKYFYVGSQNGYSVLIDQNAKISNRNSESALTDFFVVNDSDSIFKYYFSVTRLSFSKEAPIDIYGDDYIQSFQLECSCSVESNLQVSYNNLDGVELKISAMKDQIELGGLSFSSVSKDNVLYSITYLTKSENIITYLSEYKSFINSFVVNTVSGH